MLKLYALIQRKARGGLRFIHNLCHPFDTDLTMNSDISRECTIVTYATHDDLIQSLKNMALSVHMEKSYIRFFKGHFLYGKFSYFKVFFFWGFSERMFYGNC